jgi:hypothetical protein
LLAVEPDLSSTLFLLIGTLLLALPDAALANWWIVRASDKMCLVVDIEPTRKDKSVTKIGKEAYLTCEEAEADVKRLCNNETATIRTESQNRATTAPSARTGARSIC